MKKTLCASLMSAMLTFTAGSAFAADAPNWPPRPVQVVVIANPGGDTDFNARMMAKYFNQITGKTMVVTNVAGGGGTLAAEQVKGAAADGNTILFTHPGQLTVNEVAGLTEDSYETFDVACFSHAQGLMLEKLSGIKLKMVDGGTVSDRVVGMLGGRLDLGAITYGSVQDYVNGGQMVALGQPNDARNPLLGDVPTLKEQGLDLTMDKPYVVAFPKGTDPAIVAKMADLMKQITEIPEYAEDLKKFKQPVAYFGTEDAKAILAKTRDDFMQFKDELRQGK